MAKVAAAKPAVGYSGKPLVEKLGLKAGMKAVFLKPPARYERTLGPLPNGVVEGARLAGGMDFVQVFVTSAAELEKQITKLRDSLADTGMVWVSWPKKASGVATDLTEDVVRQIALPTGLVDVKVCAVDETWSGLKLVKRVSERTGSSKVKAAAAVKRK